MLTRLVKLRSLDLDIPSSAGRVAHLSAASGLVRAGELLYVVADDELHLGVFSVDPATPGRLLRVFAGDLPLPPAERKARKPDLEAIVRIPDGTLLAIPSGSKKRRHKGVRVELDDAGHVEECDFSGIFGALEDRVPSPNIEGAFVFGEELCLLQRANQRRRQNAILRYALKPFLDAIRTGARLEPLGIHPLELGTIEGVALGLTDGAALPDGRFVFSAVAEDTSDAYLDGRCAGTALGVAGRDGRVDSLHQLEHPHKVEGVEASVEDASVRLLLVTDADDAAIPAGLFSAAIPLPERSAG